MMPGKQSEAGGRPAMRAVPESSRPDRVLLCLHGGGFAGGSVYTHRKMFGHGQPAVAACYRDGAYQALGVAVLVARSGFLPAVS